MKEEELGSTENLEFVPKYSKLCGVYLKKKNSFQQVELKHFQQVLYHE